MKEPVLRVPRAAGRSSRSVLLWKFNISEGLQGPMPRVINIVEAEAGCQDDATFMNVDGIQPIEGTSLRPQDVDPAKHHGARN